MEGKKQEKYFFLVEFISGGISAIISKSLFSPLEVIKLRLQCGNEMVKIGTIETPYLGITDCWRKIVSEEGVKALWKGNGTNILKHFSTLTLNFALHHQIKAIFAQNSPSGYWIQLFSFLASGAAAGMLSMALIYHLDYARVRLTNDK
jgi:solute carrier family 25 (adenine nucleotide translocator) protein 4/5/6/31